MLIEIRPDNGETVTVAVEENRVILEIDDGEHSKDTESAAASLTEEEAALVASVLHAAQVYSLAHRRRKADER